MRMINNCRRHGTQLCWILPAQQPQSAFDLLGESTGIACVCPAAAGCSDVDKTRPEGVWRLIQHGDYEPNKGLKVKRIDVTILPQVEEEDACLVQDGLVIIVVVELWKNSPDMFWRSCPLNFKIRIRPFQPRGNGVRLSGNESLCFALSF